MPQDTELHKVAKDGDTSGVADLLATGVNINAPGAQGRTALHRALGGGFTECATALLDAGADASVIDAMKRSSLHWAALAPEADKAFSVLQLLFEHASSSGAAASQINHQTKSGATPLHCACSSNRVEMARFLLERGADPNLEDDDGKTCAALAKESGMPKDLFGGGRGRRDSKSSKGGFFARMRRASLGGSAPPEVSL